jgi:DNA replication protein DnaC
MELKNLLPNVVESLTSQETSPESQLVKRRFVFPSSMALEDDETRKKLIACGWYKLYLDAEWTQTENSDYIKEMLKKEFWFNNAEYSKGMFITGSVGVGKTSLIALIGKYFAKYFPIMPYFVPTGVLFDMYFEKKYTEVNKLMESTVLFLDDLGREYGSDYPLSKFENFMEYRYGNMLPTFITSNLKIEDLKKREGFERIADRINDPKWMIHLLYAGETKRKRN